MSSRKGPIFREYRTIEGLKKDREYVFEEFVGSSQALATKVRTLANGLLNSNGGVIYFGVDVRGTVKGVSVPTRKIEDDYRLVVDRTIGSFLPFTPPSKYRLQFHLLENRWSKYVIELKVAAGDLGECYEDGLFNMYLVDDSQLLGPLYPQEIKDLALMRYNELTESFKFEINPAPARKANKTIPIICISDDEDDDKAPKKSNKPSEKSDTGKENHNKGENAAKRPRIEPITFNKESAYETNSRNVVSRQTSSASSTSTTVVNRVKNLFRKKK